MPLPVVSKVSYLVEPSLSRFRPVLADTTRTHSSVLVHSWGPLRLSSSSSEAARLGRWLASLEATAHPNVVAVALANKLVRTAWAVLQRDIRHNGRLLANA